jgi:REP element-mobilizing transposase RayT
MGQAYSKLMVHGVFSTRLRRPLIVPELMPELVRVVGGIIRKKDGKLLAMNGTADHVHLLAIFRPKHAVSDMFRDIKAVSCDWVHSRGPAHRSFAWQGGYSVFSVSKSAGARVEKYIARQVEHHKRKTFEEELIAFLEKHEIEYDRRYVFD